MAEFMTETKQRPAGAPQASEPPEPRRRRGAAGVAGPVPLDGHEAAVILDRARTSVDPQLCTAVERAGGHDWAQAQAADPESAGGLLALAEFVTRRSS